jgi:O-antigen ligase
MPRWLTYFLMTASLAAAVFSKGGVYPSQWEWSALGISLAACLSVLAGSRRQGRRGHPLGVTLLILLLGWILLQLVPLPASLVAQLSPARWNVVSAARDAAGRDHDSWLALSVAPAATMERLVDVLPAMAAFVAAREMGWWWGARMWLTVAPIVAIAWLESLLGLIQFYFMRMAGGAAASATGTYVNRNHFAGLMEMAFPVAIMWAIYTWRKGITRLNQPAGPAFRASALCAVAACLLIAIIVSLSRMGFLSTLAAVSLTALSLPASQRVGDFGRRRWWLWIIPIVVPLGIVVFLSTQEMAFRFADLAATEDISKDTRMEIWTDTAQLVKAYKWTGCGLGAYEHCLYPFKTVAPTNTVEFAHNDYLQILSEVGVPGGLLILAVAGWILSRLLSVVLFMRGGKNWELAVGLLAVFLALGLHSLADFNLYIPANALALAWLGGIAVSPGLKER